MLNSNTFPVLWSVSKTQCRSQQTKTKGGDRRRTVRLVKAIAPPEGQARDKPVSEKALASRPVSSDLTATFDSSNDPCMKYSLAAIGDRGLKEEVKRATVPPAAIPPLEGVASTLPFYFLPDVDEHTP